jgi:UDP-N-acetylmuramyl tripeptide synthase
MSVQGRRIGVIGAPGDRRDEDNIKLGQIAAATFDYLIIKEDWDLRGKAEGQTAELLRQTVLKAGKQPDQIKVMVNEFDAIRYALDMAQPSDLLVVLADDITGSWKLITKYRHPEVYRRWLLEQGQPPVDKRVGWQGADNPEMQRRAPEMMQSNDDYED